MAAILRGLAYERHAALLHAVRRACNDENITLAELATRLEMDRFPLYRILHGQRRIPEDFEERVAAALGITIKQLRKGR